MSVTLPAQDAYELWAETYPPVAHNPLMRVEQDVVEPLLAHIRATRALDVGTGSGRYLPLLEATGASLGASASTSRWRCCGAGRRRRAASAATRAACRSGAAPSI